MYIYTVYNIYILYMCVCVYITMAVSLTIPITDYIRGRTLGFNLLDSGTSKDKSLLLNTSLPKHLLVLQKKKINPNLSCYNFM